MTQSAEYALRAVLRIAQEPAGERVSAEVLAEELELPANYLRKVLHVLVRAGVLESSRGPHGGFGLAVCSQELTLAAVLSPFEPVVVRGSGAARSSYMEGCGCATHSKWRQLLELRASFFRDTTIASLAHAAHACGDRV